jgi:hypothetical protein
MKITNRTVFLRLPLDMQRPIPGGCQCPYCHAHRDLVPMWDTLAAHPDARHAWTVHYPDLVTGKHPLDQQQDQSDINALLDLLDKPEGRS